MYTTSLTIKWYKGVHVTDYLGRRKNNSPPELGRIQGWWMILAHNNMIDYFRFSKPNWLIFGKKFKNHSCVVQTIVTYFHLIV